MALHTSLGTDSKTVYTSHYNEPMHSGSTLDVLENGYTEASKALVPSPSFAFRNKCTAQTRSELMDFSVEYTDIGDYVVFASASNKYRFHKSDLAKYGMIHSPDEDMDEMDGWIGATVGNHAIECVEPNAEEGLFSLPEHHIDYSSFGMTDVNLPVKHLFGTVPINMVGYYLSKIANLEADLRDVIFEDYFVDGVGFNSETVTMLESLIGEGFEPREIAAIGVENLDSAIAATYPGEKAVLVASKDMYDKCLAIAEAYGMTGDDAVKFAKRAIWYHELHHVFDQREGVSKTHKETDDGEFFAEFFGERASILEGKISEYYKALARENEDYAQGYRDGSIKISEGNSLNSRVTTLINKYASEAEGMGLEGKEARAYVATQLEEYVSKSGEESEGSESKPEAKSSKYSKRAAAKSNAKDSGADSSDDATEEEGDADDDSGDGGAEE